MGDFASTIPTNDGKEHVIAAAQHILKALSKYNLNDDTRRLVADLHSQLSTVSVITQNKGVKTKDVEEKLEIAQKKVLRWESNRSTIWASGPEGASEYLRAVQEVRRLTENLAILLPNRCGKQRELLGQAQAVLHMSMERLEEELNVVLAQNKQLFELEHVSFHSCDDVSLLDSVDSIEEKETSEMNSYSSEYEGPMIDLLNPDAISDVISIARVMFSSNYGREFRNAFVKFWKDALDEYLSYLGIENLSIEDSLRIEWKCMSSKVKRWIWAIKLIVRVFLSSEKKLFEQVLGEFGPICSTSFVEANRASLTCLLNFGQAMVIAPRRPEMLFSLLDMYEMLSYLVQEIHLLFPSEEGSFIRTEFRELLMGLGDSAKATLSEFISKVTSNPSRGPFPRGDIHPLTKYVMNYINLIFVYADTLNILFETDPCSFSCHLRSLAFNLESNLEQKSMLYKDPALREIFKMNNFHYMVQKVKGSDLRKYFGDEWVRDHTAKFQQNATVYERETWNPILSLLRDDGNLSKVIMKERCKLFGNAFEEVYKNQTGWFVHDPELRKDLRVSILQKLIHAYRPFVHKVSDIISEKYVKYNADDLDNYVCSLFEGSSKSLHHVWKK